MNVVPKSSDPQSDHDATGGNGAMWSASIVLLVAFNLRPMLTSVAPLAQEVGRDLSLPSLGVTVLLTLPVVCLGAFGPLAPPLARRYGIETVLLLSLATMALGCGLRLFGRELLFAGTVLIGAGMSALGVLAPTLIKQDFASKTGLMMGLYAMLIALGAAASTASSIPLLSSFDESWRLALVFWVAPVLLTILVLARRPAPVGRHDPGISLARNQAFSSPLAWQVTAFFALVAALAYAVFSWGPSMLASRGLNQITSGLYISFSYFAQMPSGLITPILAAKMRDQRLVASATVVLTSAGLMGILFAPTWSLAVFCVILGIGQGGAFGVALLLIVLRSGSPTIAAQLSGLSQSIGYIVGGILGPLCVGIVHDSLGGWAAVAVFYLVLSALSLAVGIAAGRDRLVS